MKKIFSFMLIAVGLLISGQMKAVDWASMPETNNADYDASVTIGGITKYCSLTDAFAAVNSKTATIEMLKTPERIDGAKSSGTRKTFGANTDLTWNLNGKTVNFYFYGFLIDGGKVKLTGEGTLHFEGQYISQKDYDKNPVACNEIYKDENKIEGYGDFYYYIQMKGSTDPSKEEYSVLVIDKDVSITTNNYGYEVQVMNNGGFAYGVVLDVYGTLLGKWGVTVNGNIGGEGKNIPQIIIEKGASIIASPCQSALYAAGKADYKIYGTLTGGTCIYAKSGNILVDGATIISNAEDEEYVAPTPNGSGFDGGAGSAIVLDSKKGYNGEMTLTIQGDSYIEGTAGYAIDELKTDAEVSKTDAVVIKSGEINGGSMGCLNTTAEVKENVKVHGTITGGTFSDETIKEYISKVDGVIEVNVGDEIRYVVNGMPEGKTWVSTIAAASATDYVKITDNEEVPFDKTIAYLNIPGANKVTVKTGAKLSVGEVVLGELAVIEVEAGGTLIVNGTNGLIAFEPENIVIKADATNGMGTFVLNPAVKANKSPWATVEYMTGEYCGSETLFGKTKYHWEVLASPFAEILKITSDAAYFSHVVNGNFETCSRTDIVNDTEAFGVFAICSNTTQGNPTKFVFEGKLQGANSLENYGVNKKFNYMGNAYMGKMNAKEMVQELQQSASAVHTLVYLWNVQYMKWDSYTGYQLDELGNVNPMAAIVLYSDKEGSINLDYEKLIWNTNK